MTKCKSPEQITIPDSVEYIGAEAFIDCESLKRVDISDTLKDKYPESFIGTPWYEAQKQ